MAVGTLIAKDGLQFVANVNAAIWAVELLVTEYGMDEQIAAVLVRLFCAVTNVADVDGRWIADHVWFAGVGRGME